jgi:hypothetical protein
MWNSNSSGAFAWIILPVSWAYGQNLKQVPYLWCLQ